MKGRRRTAAQVEQLEEQIMDVLDQDHPQSVRHIFYRMTDPRLPEPVEKTERGYVQVQNRLVLMRRNGTVPYGWITDATRRGYFVDTFRGAGDFLKRIKGLYRADLWQQSDFYCEVWCESRSIAGVVEEDCEELAVNLYPAGGFSSLTLAFEAAENINEIVDGKPVVIFYIGDYDPAGVLIDISIEKELRTHLDPNIDLTFRRIGITPDQIVQYGLPTKPRKNTDRRALHITATVEAEAMPAGIMRGLLRDQIESLLPPNALEVAKAAEQSERAYLDRLAQRRRA
jgi:predicted transcriptional regulator